jgi:short-subunit dehydrogenase
MDTEPAYTLITGGSRGIGKALAREFARRGMHLLLVARTAAGLDAASREITKEFAVRVHTLQADLSEPGSARKVVDWCKKEGYRVNILVNNAGIAGTVRFENASPEYFNNILQVNTASLVMLTRLLLPELRTHPEAFVLNVGSLAGYFSIPYKSIYAASKAFVKDFSLALCQELKDGPVRVTVVNPNGIPTNADIDKRIDTHSRLVRRFFITHAEKIARISVNKMLKGKAVVVPGFHNRALILVYRMIPPGTRGKWLSGIIRKEIGE